MRTLSNLKVKTLPSLSKISEKNKLKGNKIVLCHGVFDLLHPGHIRYFKSAKSHGDILIVTIIADKFVDKGPGRPIFHQDLRAEVLSAIDVIDYISIVNSASVIDVIKKIKPDLYVKGTEYIDIKEFDKSSNTTNEEERALKEYGGKIVITDDQIVFSSSKIISDYLEVYPQKTKKYLNLIKNKYTSEQIINDLEKLKIIKIMIIGDTIIDQYHYCLPLGKSSKEPVMVHQYISEESYAGGVLATANHTASLSHHINLVTILGKKRSFRSFIIKKLRTVVNPTFFYYSNGSTIIKRRFLDENTKQKLFQVSYLKDDFVLPKLTENEIINYLNKEIPRYDMVIVNDFGHGLLTKKIIRNICKKAKYLTLNVQANSANFGFNIITKYPRADYVCIDNQEIRLATHDKFSDLKPLIKKIYRRMNCNFIIVTRGPKGSMSYSNKFGFIEAPALSDRIVDRVGAGDALFAITSPCVYAGMPGDLVTFIGNVAGALKVQVVGNKKQIEFSDMAKYITRLLK
jgi:rfaE bifunctional protein nucleotidyltransferase chain/domain